jgi:hypothetical protein
MSCQAYTPTIRADNGMPVLRRLYVSYGGSSRCACSFDIINRTTRRLLILWYRYSTVENTFQEDSFEVEALQSTLPKRKPTNANPSSLVGASIR